MPSWPRGLIFSWSVYRGRHKHRSSDLRGLKGCGPCPREGCWCCHKYMVPVVAWCSLLLLSNSVIQQSADKCSVDGEKLHVCLSEVMAVTNQPRYLVHNGCYLVCLLRFVAAHTSLLCLEVSKAFSDLFLTSLPFSSLNCTLQTICK